MKRDLLCVGISVADTVIPLTAEPPISGIHWKFGAQRDQSDSAASLD